MRLIKVRRGQTRSGEVGQGQMRLIKVRLSKVKSGETCFITKTLRLVRQEYVPDAPIKSAWPETKTLANIL